MAHHKPMLFVHTWILLANAALLVWTAQDRHLGPFVLACLVASYSVHMIKSTLDEMAAERAAGAQGEE